MYCLTGIRAHRFGAKADNVTLFDKKPDRRGIGTGRMRPVCTQIDIIRAAPTRPASAHQHPALRWNFTMLSLEGRNLVDAHLIVIIGI